MSHFNRQDALRQSRGRREEQPRPPFSAIAGRFANWITGADGIADEDRDYDEYELFDREYDARDSAEDEVEGVRDVRPIAAGPADDWHGAPPERPMRADAIEHADDEQPSRFPLVGLGYDRTAVDELLCELERELAQLRADSRGAPSIAEELERLGEQTASILVVAHDQAQETTRQALITAERRVAEASEEARAITTRAHERLRELDSETDSVWRARERLLDDVRVASAALAQLADDASARFPTAPAGATASFEAVGMAPPASSHVSTTPATCTPAPRSSGDALDPSGAVSAQR